MKLSFQIFLIFLVFISVVYLVRPLRAEIYLKKGIAYVDNGFPFKAIHEYNRALKSDRSNGKIYFQKGVAYGKLSQKGSAKNRAKHLASSMKAYTVAANYSSDIAVDFYLSAGYEALGDLNVALEKYLKVLKRGPSDMAGKEAFVRLKYVYKGLGDKSLTNGDTAKAIDNYKNAVKLNKLNIKWGTIEEYEKYRELMPLNILVKHWLADAYFEKKKFKKAVIEFEKLVDFGYVDDEFLYKLRDSYFFDGEHNLKNKMFDDALNSFLKASEMFLGLNYRHNLKSILKVSEVYDAKEDIEGAVNALLKMENIISFKGQGYFYAGKLYEKKGLLKEAALNYEKYYEIFKPKDINTLRLLGSLYVRMKDFKKANETYLRFEDFTHLKGQGYYEIALLYRKRELWKKSIEYFEKYLPFKSPGDFHVHRFMASLYEKLGNLDKAFENYLKMEEYEIIKGQGFYKIAGMYEKRSDFIKATNYYEKCIEAGNMNDINIFLKLGSIYEKIGDLNLAKENYMRFELLDYTTKGEGYTKIAKMYEKNNHTEEAIKSYKKVLSIDRFKIDSYFAMANLYLKLNDLDNAFKLYSKVLENDSSNIKGFNKKSYFEMSKIYKKLGNNKKSVEAYRSGINEYLNTLN